MTPLVAVARTDVEATPGTTIHSVTKAGACAGADVRRTIVLTTATHSLIVLDDTSEHLDQWKCEASCASTADFKQKPPQIVRKCPRSPEVR